MAGNHLAIGQGLGEASVWNPTPAIQAFSNVLQQQKAQRQAEQQQLIQQMGSIDTTKLRDPDKEDYYNKFNDWRNQAISAYQLPQNSRERMMQQGIAAQKLNELKGFVAESARQAAEHKQIGNMMLQDQFRHQFTDDAVNKWAQSNNLPMSNAGFISDPSTLERQVDHEKVDKAVESALQKKLGETNNWQMTKVPGKTGDKTGTWVQQTNSIPYDGEQGVAHMLLNGSTVSRDFKKSIDDRYGNIQGANPQETDALRMHQYAVDKGWDKGFSKAEKPEFKPNRAPDLYAYHLGLREAAKDQAPVVEPKAVQPLPDGAGHTYNAKNFVAVSLPNKNFAGTPAIDVDTRKAVKALSPSDNYSVVAAFDAPVYKSDRKGAGNIVPSHLEQQAPDAIEHKRMILVQKKGEYENEPTQHFLIDYDKLPANIANQKDVRQALGGLNKTPVYGQQPKMSPQDFNAQWSKLPKGAHLVGPDGVTYTKR